MFKTSFTDEVCGSTEVIRWGLGEPFACCRCRTVHGSHGDNEWFIYCSDRDWFLWIQYNRHRHGAGVWFHEHACGRGSRNFRRVDCDYSFDRACHHCGAGLAPTTNSGRRKCYERLKLVSVYTWNNNNKNNNYYCYTCTRCHITHIYFKDPRSLFSVSIRSNTRKLCFCRWRTGALDIPTFDFSFMSLPIGIFSTEGD